MNKSIPSIKRMGPLWDILINLIYPNYCLICGNYISYPESRPVCRQCWDDVIVHIPPFCTKCGRPLNSLVSSTGFASPITASEIQNTEYGITESQSRQLTSSVADTGTNSGRVSKKNVQGRKPLCPDCSSNKYKYYFQQGWTVTAFNGIIKECIHLLKYQGKRSLARPLGSLMAFFYQNYLKTQGFELIIPVPLSRLRYREREFNQAELLARHVARASRVKIANDVLVRSKHTPAQVNLSRDQRLINLQEAFRVKSKADISGKNVLLIDDVFTTGSTLSECARTLREAGASRVCVFALGRG